MRNERSTAPPVPEVPPALAALLSGRPHRQVWSNSLGGVTYEVGGHQRSFVKWLPRSSGLDLAAEADRMRWAAAYAPVPEVVDVGGDADGSWLVTAALPGRSAVHPQWRADPARAVPALGRSLRALHDRLPVAGCPYSWSAPSRVADARRRVQGGLVDRARWEREHARDLHDALAAVAEPPPVDRLIVCHGDACAPNTLLLDDASWSGIVDLGDLGVADRWADLAVATWSAGYNYGPRWERPLLDAYGVDPDPVRTAYYRLLWDLGP